MGVSRLSRSVTGWRCKSRKNARNLGRVCKVSTGMARRDVAGQRVREGHAAIVVLAAMLVAVILLAAPASAAGYAGGASPQT